MLDDATKRSALLQLSFAALKVLLATDLAEEPLTQAQYVSMTGLARGNVQIGLAECVRLAYLTRTDVNPRRIEYRIPISRQRLASQQVNVDSLQRHDPSTNLSDVDSLRVNVDSLQRQHLSPTPPPPSDSDSTLTLDSKRVESNASRASAGERSNFYNPVDKKTPDRSQLESLANASSRALGDEDSISMHFRIWSTALRSGNPKLLTDLRTLVAQLADKRGRTDAFVGAIFTSEAKALFRRYDVILVLKPTDQSHDEFNAEIAEARAAMSQTQQPTDN